MQKPWEVSCIKMLLGLSYAIMSIRLDIIEAMGVLNPIVAKFQQAHFRSQCNRMLELYELKKLGTGSWLSDPTSSVGPTNRLKGIAAAQTTTDGIPSANRQSHLLPATVTTQSQEPIQMLLSFLWFQLLFNLCQRIMYWCFSWCFSSTCCKKCLTHNGQV